MLSLLRSSGTAQQSDPASAGKGVEAQRHESQRDHAQQQPSEGLAQHENGVGMAEFEGR